MNLAEKIVLMSIQKDTGKIDSRATYFMRFGLISAILIELINRKKVGVDGNKIYVIDSSKTGDTVLDMGLEAIKKKRRIDNFIFGNSTLKYNSKKEILRKFVDDGSLQENEERFLLIFKLKRYPVYNDKEKNIVEGKLRDALLNDDKDSEGIILASLAASCVAEFIVLSKEEKKKIKDKLKLIRKTEYFKFEDDIMKMIQKAISRAIASEHAAAG